VIKELAEITSHQISEIIRTTKKVNVHEHFRLPDLKGDWANLSSILPRAYIGFFDFYPGLKEPVFPSEDWEIPSEPHEFIRFYKRCELTPKLAVNAGMKSVHGIDLGSLSSKDSGSPEKINLLNQKIRNTYQHPSTIVDFLHAENITHTIFEINEAWFPPTKEHIHFAELMKQKITPHKLLRINSLLYGFDPTCWNPNTQLLMNFNRFTHKKSEYPSTFNQFLDNIDELLDYAKKEAIGLKCASAYERTIDFGTPDILSEKSKITYMYGHKLHNVLLTDVIKFGNFVFHYILKNVQENWGETPKKVPIQIHTGTAIPSGSHPGNLEPLFAAYPNITFELLHFAYPWCDAVIPLLKKYPNTLSDFVWLPQLDPNQIDRNLLMIHQNNLWSKIIAYGGDCNCVEGSIGALHVLNEHVGRFFTDLVEKGKTRADDVMSIIENMYYNNACSYWHL
jgi:hypothetical protein